MPSHPIPALSPPRHLRLPPPNPLCAFSRLLFGVGWTRQSSGPSRGFPAAARIGGMGGRMLSPLGHAAELMSRHSLRNERRLALTGSPGLGATALSKELIFPDSFSPNKAVFGTADTSQPRTQRPGGWRRGSPCKGGEKSSSAPISPALPAARACFWKFLEPAWHGQDGRGGRRVLPVPHPRAPQKLLRAPEGPSPIT